MEKYYREAASRVEWCPVLGDWVYTDEFIEGATGRVKAKGHFPVGNIDDRGYAIIKITINGKGRSLKFHRLVWYKVMGEIPTGDIDHIDGDKLNNSIHNLRDVSKSTNQRNAKMKSNNNSGYTGVSWVKRSSKWYAYINVNGKRRNLGLFNKIEDAIEARQLAQGKIGGFTERHGK